MDKTRVAAFKLLSSAIVAGGFYIFLVIMGHNFDVFELLGYILLLYLGTLAVNSMAKKLDKAKPQDVIKSA